MKCLSNLIYLGWCSFISVYYKDTEECKKIMKVWKIYLLMYWPISVSTWTMAIHTKDLYKSLSIHIKMLVCCFSTFHLLILKLCHLQELFPFYRSYFPFIYRSYFPFTGANPHLQDLFPFNVGKKVPLHAKFIENNIFFPMNLWIFYLLYYPLIFERETINQSFFLRMNKFPIKHLRHTMKIDWVCLFNQQSFYINFWGFYGVHECIKQRLCHWENKLCSMI